MILMKLGGFIGLVKWKYELMSMKILINALRIHAAER